MRRRSSEATRRRRGAQRAAAPRVRGVVLLEVLIALAILILGMAAVGMQVNVGLRVANNSEIATRAVMLAQSKLAELDAGIVQLVPNEELEGDFGGRPAGLRVEISPSHPGFPNGWCLRHYGFLGVNYPGLDTLRLDPHRSLRLKYRVTVYDR